MVDIAIVEDNEREKNRLAECIACYMERVKRPYKIQWFTNSESFIDNYSARFDLVFMDIQLPGMDGLRVCKKLRDFDTEVPIIFVTNMAQYAAKGYVVDALDFIVKPISYDNFQLAMSRAIERIDRRDTVTVTARIDNGFVKMPVSTILYVEVFNHDLIYHTESGIVKTYGALKTVENLLIQAGFFKCSRCQLVNIKYVTALKGQTVVLGKEEVTISRLRRKDFLAAVANYFGGGSK